MFRKLIVSLLMILTFQALASADNLKGRVLDPQGRVVADARLRLFDRKSGQLHTTVSNSEGGFSFAGIAAGTYLLEADAASSALSVSKEISLRGDQSEDLQLRITGTNVEVLVTATGAPQVIEEVAKSVSVVDSDTIQQRDELSITEAIRNLPGIRVKQLEGPGSFVTIKTRGLRTQDTAILIDGMRFRDAASPQGDASAFLQSMTTVDTDRIEFLRGSGSSLYGSHALAGVLSINSRSGGGSTHGEWRAEGGGLGLIRSVLGIGGGVRSDRLTYSGTVSHLNVTKGVRNGAPYRNTSPQGTVRYTFLPGLTATGRVWYANDYLTATENPAFTPAILANSPATGEVKAIALPIDQLELFEKKQPFSAGNATFIPNQIDPDGRRMSSFLSTSGALEHQVSSMTSYRVFYQRVNTKRTHMDGPAGSGSFEPATIARSNFNGNTDVVQGRFDQRAGAYNFINVGYEFEREKYFSFNGLDSSVNFIDLQQRSSALFVQDQIRLAGGQLQLTVAGRVQSFKLEAPTFKGFTSPYNGVSAVEPPTAYTGDGSLAYFFRQSGTKLRGHVGNSFRAPSGYERYGGGGGFYYGDPKLAPDRAVAVDGGIDQWLLGTKLQLSGTIFYTNLQQTVTFANSLPAGDAFGRFFGYRNSGGGIARGLEFSAHVAPSSRTKFDAAYTYTNSDQRTPSIAGTNYYRILGVSPHNFTFTLTQWIGSRVNIAYDMSVLSKYTNTLFGGGARQFVFDGPHKADVVVNYEHPLSDRRSFQIYAKVENIFNQRAYEDGFIGPKAWAIAGFRLKY